MTVPVSQTSKMSLKSHTFKSFDEKLCRLIFTCLHEDFQAYLDKDLDPNYCLKTDVSLEEEGIIFKKGSSLIFIVIRSCTISTRPWDLWMMMNLLLDKGVNLDKPVECEGGGEINVLEYACENASLINEEVFSTLLKAASSQAALAAIEKIKDPRKKESIKQQILPERFPRSHALSSTSLEPLLSSSPSLLIFNEEEICHCLVEGDITKLRLLLDNGLNPDYVLTQNIIIGGLTCEKGYTLLLLVLQACVASNDFFYYLEIILLLFEKKASLERECFGITPLSYVCEHESVFSEDLIVCFLSSVNKVLAFHTVSKISNLKCKERIAGLIHSKDLMFQFEPIETEGEEKKEIQKIKEDLLAFTDICSMEKPRQSVLVQHPIIEKGFKSEDTSHLSSASGVSLTAVDTRISPESSTKSSNPTVFISEKIAEKKEKSAFFVSDFFKKLTTIIVNVEDFHSPNASICYGDQVNELLTEIISNNFSGLKNILQSSELLQACNEEVRSCTSGKETLLSALLHKLNNSCFKHKVCCLFLEYGLDKEEKIYNDLNLLEFLCSFIPGNKVYPSVLIQTILLVIFYYSDETLIKEGIKYCTTEKEKKNLLYFFTDKAGNFSIQSIDLPNVVSDIRFQKLVLAFLEVSLLLNTNVITGEPWNGEVIFPLLNELDAFLQRQSLSVGSEVIKKRKTMVGLFEALLLAGIHSNSYKESSKNLYINFFNENKEVVYMSSQIKKEVTFLLQKYWGWIFDKENPTQSKLFISGPRVFLGLFNQYTGSYGFKISEISEAIEVNDFSKLEELLEDNKAFNECNQEVKSFFLEETCFSALFHTQKDSIYRHKIFIIFLKHGFSLNEIVYKNMTVLQFLCMLRGDIYMINTNKSLLLQTICLGLFLLEDNSESIESIINDCCFEDRKRLEEFFFSKTTSRYSNKHLCLEDKINSSIYFLVKKAMIEASIIVNKNVMTNKSLNIKEINCWLRCVINSLSTLLIGFGKPSVYQEKAINKKNRLLYIYEFLLIFMKSYQFPSEELKDTYSLLKQQLEKVIWRNNETKLFLLMLLQRHLGFLIKDSKKRRKSTETEVLEKKLKVLEPSIFTVNMEKIDVFYTFCEYGSKVETILAQITNDDFGQIKEIVKSPLLLEEYNQEVSSYTHGEETLLSALVFKLKDINIQNRICCLFLKHGLSLSTIVSKNHNVLEFFCSLKKTHTVSSMLKIICLFIFAFKNEISLDNVINACHSVQDQKKLKSFFIDSKGNFSVSAVNLDSVVMNATYSSLVQAFIDASVCLNKNVITDEPLNTNFLFSWIHQLLKTFLNTRKTGLIGMYRRNTLISTFETLLFAAIQKNSYEITDRNEYSIILQRNLVFNNSDMEKTIKFLIQKYWGCVLEK